MQSFGGGGRVSKYKLNDEPICPWCDYKIEDWSEYRSLRNDGDQQKDNCPNCNKELEITLCVTYQFSTVGMGCSPHKFDLSDSYKLIGIKGMKHLEFICVLCKAEFYDWAFEGGKHQSLTKNQYEFLGEGAKAAAERNL